jgi:hypothetical protein
MTLYELAVAIILSVFFIVLTWFIIESNRMISERNRLRKETGKYYDFDIVEELERREREKQTTGIEPEKVATKGNRKSKTTTAKTEL